MCIRNDRVKLRVPVSAECSHTGKFRWVEKEIDKCIAPHIQALNKAGLFTGAHCCGHGEKDGYISFHDGTVFIVKKTTPKNRVNFTFDERSFTTLEEIEEAGHFPPMEKSKLTTFNEIQCRNPKTGEVKTIIIPKIDLPKVQPLDS